MGQSTLWRGDRVAIRVIAAAQTLLALNFLAITPFMFNYGGAAANPEAFQRWILFWVAGVGTALALLTGHLLARVAVIAWSGFILWYLGDGARRQPLEQWLATWLPLVVAYLSVSAGMLVRRGWTTPESRKPVVAALGVTIAAIAAVGAYEFVTGTERFERWQLTSRSSSARCAAAEALAAKGPAAREALPALESMMENTVCARFAEDKLPEYIEAVGGIDPFLRVLATGGAVARHSAAARVSVIARRYPQRRADVLDAFRAGLNDSDHTIRLISAMGLGRLGSAAAIAVPDLVQALQDSDRDVRSAAVETLARVRSLDGLKAAAHHSDAQIRQAAIQKLGGMSADEIASSRQMDADLLAQVPSAAARRRIEDYAPTTDLRGYGPAALDALVDALDDPDEATATAAAKGLSNLGRAALPAVAPLSRAALHAPATNTRSEALHALKRIGPEGLPTIETAVYDADTHVRDYAIALLGSYGQAGARTLAALLDGPWSDGSRRAISALDSLKGDARPALAALERASRNAPDPAARKEAIGVLVKIGPEGFSAVEKARNDPDPSVRAEAEAALKAMQRRYRSH